MYTIDIEPEERPKSESDKTKELLNVMLEVMETIEHVDDAGYTLRFKLLSNIEFLIDNLMEEYEQSRK